MGRCLMSLYIRAPANPPGKKNHNKQEVKIAVKEKFSYMKQGQGERQDVECCYKGMEIILMLVNQPVIQSINEPDHPLTCCSKASVKVIYRK